MGKKSGCGGGGWNPEPSPLFVAAFLTLLGFVVVQVISALLWYFRSAKPFS